MATKKKKSVPKVAHKEKMEREPEFMVNVSDPKMLRKNILESLREVIIFMQSYEKFKQIQEQKVLLFSQLKGSVRQLNLLLDHKLRNYLPKGKLQAAQQQMEEREEVEERETVKETKPVQVKAAPKQKVIDDEVPDHELDELEEQLQDIENQLRGV